MKTLLLLLVPSVCFGQIFGDGSGSTRVDVRIGEGTIQASKRSWDLIAGLPSTWQGETKYVQRQTRFTYGEQYSLFVSCNQRSKVGIAVDGRSTLSGRQVTGNYAMLATWKQYAGDRVHVMGPGEVNEVRGWRESGGNTGTIRRFVATTAARSLSAAWGDPQYGMVGTIVIAIFPEIPSQTVYGSGPAGTGAGTREYSPNQTVQFTSTSVASEVFLIRYTLDGSQSAPSVSTPRDRSRYIGPIAPRW